MTDTVDQIVCLASPDAPDSHITRTSEIADKHGLNTVTHHVGGDPEDIAWDTTQLVVAIGGDGTFLEAVRLTTPSETPFMAVNSGTLGFLARIHPDNIEPAVEEAITGDAETVTREMLQVTGAVSGTGINDVMVEPLPPETPTDRKITTVHAYIDETYVGEFTGSGIAVSTPTGSTAVAFSAGGPVHYPNANSALQITPLHTHNAGVRPVIVDASTEIRLVAETRVKVAVDGGRKHGVIEAGDVLHVTGAEESAHIIRTPYDESFFDAMAGKLGWGIRDIDEEGPLERAEE